MAHDALPISLLKQIEALETRLTFQEDWLDTLDRTIIEQRRQIEHLERAYALMQQRLCDQSDALHRMNATLSPADERPPHY